MLNKRNHKSRVILEKIFWLIIGLSGIIVGIVVSLFYQTSNDTPLTVLYFFSICAILLGIFFLFYSLKLQPIEVRDKGITLRQRRVKDILSGKDTILVYTNIDKIKEEGNIVIITIRNKRIPFRVLKEHIDSYEELLKKIQEQKIIIEQ